MSAGIMKTEFGEPVIQWTGGNILAVNHLIRREIWILSNGSLWFNNGVGEMISVKRDQLIKVPKCGDKIIVLDMKDVVIESG